MENAKQPDWKIGDLYEKALGLVKKHKVLWLFGLTLSYATGASFRFSNFSNFSQLNTTFKNIFQPNTNTSHKVLGDSTNVVLDTISYLFSSVPIVFYLLIALELITVFGFAIVIFYVLRAWAEAGLLEGIQSGIENSKVTIRETSEKALHNILPLIGVRIIPSLVFYLTFFVGAAILLVIGFLVNVILGIFVTIALLCLFLVGIIVLNLSLTWAVREIVIEKKLAEQAFFAGLRITKRKFWSSVLLGTVNLLIGGAIISGILISFAFVIIIFAVLGIIIKNVALIGVFIGAIFLIPSIYAFLLLSGIITAFKAAVWSFAFNNIRGKYDK